MTLEKVREVIELYIKELEGRDLEARNNLSGYMLHERLAHVLWKLHEMRGWVTAWKGLSSGRWEKEWEKIHRWLGFCKGVLWTTDVYTIDKMREHNREIVQD